MLSHSSSRWQRAVTSRSTVESTITRASALVIVVVPTAASRADSRVLQAVGRATPAETYQTTAAVSEVTKEAKPSEGLKVAELKAALAEKGIEIPDGVTLKADLAALLDAAADEEAAK